MVVTPIGCKNAQLHTDKSGGGGTAQLEACIGARSARRHASKPAGVRYASTIIDVRWLFTPAAASGIFDTYLETIRVPGVHRVISGEAIEIWSLRALGDNYDAERAQARLLQRHSVVTKGVPVDPPLHAWVVIGRGEARG